MTDVKVEAARIEVERSRAQMLDTAKLLQRRLEPGKLTRDAWQSAKEKGADLAEDAVDAVRQRPYAAGGVVAALALFIAREPIKQLFGKLTDAMTSDEEETEETQWPGSPVPVARKAAPRASAPSKRTTAPGGKPRAGSTKRR